MNKRKYPACPRQGSEKEIHSFLFTLYMISIMLPLLPFPVPSLLFTVANKEHTYRKADPYRVRKTDLKSPFQLALWPQQNCLRVFASFS